MLLFFDIGASELMLIFLVIIIFFGANKIPEIAREMGKGIRQLKDATSGIQREIEKSIQENAEPRKTELPKTKQPENTVIQNPENAKVENPETLNAPQPEVTTAPENKQKMEANPLSSQEENKQSE